MNKHILYIWVTVFMSCLFVANVFDTHNITVKMLSFIAKHTCDCSFTMSIRELYLIDLAIRVLLTSTLFAGAFSTINKLKAIEDNE